MKFKKGDKVRAKKGAPYIITTDGWEGKVTKIYSNGRIKVNGYDVDPDYFELVEHKNECIVIYRKGNETIALDKRTGEKAVARCCPEDEYDFETGAKLAFSRLVDTPHGYNGKIIFTKGDEVFKTGHIFDIVDGRITAPNCQTVPNGERFKDIDDVKDYFTGNLTDKRKRKYGWSPFTLTLIEVKE